MFIKIVASFLFALILVLLSLSSCRTVLASGTSPQHDQQQQQQQLPLSCSSVMPIEHLFYDLRQEEEENSLKSSDGADADATIIRSPVSLKLRCKASGCPELNGTRILLKDVGSPSRSLLFSDVNRVPVWCEETSGWVLFWHDASWTKPLVPKVGITEADRRAGYLYVNGKSAGKIFFDCK